MPGVNDVAEVYSPSFNGVALVNVTTGAVEKRLQSFSAPTTQQAGGSYNGTSAVWKDYSSLDSLNEFTVWVWNSRTGKITQVGEAHRDSTGTAFNSPWFDPVISSDAATWIEGTNNSGVGEVHLLDLSSCEESVVDTSHAASAFLYQGDVMWAQSDAPGHLTRLKAVKVATKQATTLPAGLLHEQGGWGFTVDGSSVSWVGKDSASLWSIATPTSRPRKLVQIHNGGFNPPLFYRDGIVAMASTGGIEVVNTLDCGGPGRPRLSDLLTTSTSVASG